jgi:phosphatidylglycerol:prolipoprotein diacylglycerol transferase
MTDIMNATDIAFPHLGLYLKNVPKSIMIGNFSIAFYGIIISCGIVLGFCMAAWYGAKYGLDKELYWDLSIYGVVGGILGARIYYVVFAWDYYKEDLLSIFNIRQGGLAIYGGVIAAFTVVYFFSKVKKISPLLMFDSLAFGFPVGQLIGRWGNFTNREAFGDYTDSLFAMRLPIEAVRNREITDRMWEHVGEGINYIQVHPTFLYESLWNVGLLTTLVLLYKKKKFDGEIALWYLGGYGAGRLWIEALRTDQLHIGSTNIAVSQCVAAGCILIACILEVVIRVKKKARNQT